MGGLKASSSDAESFIKETVTWKLSDIHLPAERRSLALAAAITGSSGFEGAAFHVTVSSAVTVLVEETGYHRPSLFS